MLVAFSSPVLQKCFSGVKVRAKFELNCTTKAISVSRCASDSKSDFSTVN